MKIARISFASDIIGFIFLPLLQSTALIISSQYPVSLASLSHIFILFILAGTFEAAQNSLHSTRITALSDSTLYDYFGPEPGWEGESPLCGFGNRDFDTLNYRYFRIVEAGDTRFCKP